jgi:acetolactate synthase-1/2/3 large subunit
MPSDELSGAAILVESLIAAGTEVIFGVPGDTGVGLYDALHGRVGRLRHVLASDERGAVFGADAYARRGRRLGVVEVSSGGGATFAVGGLGEAFAASVPLLLVSSDIQRGSRGTGALTETDQLGLFRAVTKWQAVAGDAAELPDLVAEAVAEATGGRPAPVALIVPEDVLDERRAARVEPAWAAVPLARPAPPEADLARAAAAIAAASRPAVVAGSGVHWSGAHAALAALADRAGLAVATTIHGKGAVDEGWALSLGTCGANGARTYANEFLAGADLVLFVGTRANATDTAGFTAPPRAGPAIVQVDVEAARAGRNYPGGIGLAGDARAALEGLAELAPADAGRRARTAAWIAPRRAAWEAAFGGRPAPAGTLDPADVVRAVREVAGDELTVVGDPGTPTPYLAAGWHVSRPGRRLLLPRGHGPMGYAHPAAIGAALAAAGPVIAFVTDGSLLMAAGALETAARLALPITYVQLSNGSLGWIKALQHLYLGGRAFGTDITRVDAAAVARGFGLGARTAASPEEVAAAVRQGLAGGRPTLVDVPVPDEHELIPPVAPWERLAEGGDATRPVY